MSQHMTQEEILASVQGAQDIVGWFGYWPSFHDSEVVSIELHRSTTSHVRVHAFRGVAKTDERGHYKQEKHATVSFAIKDISSLALSGFNNQNVLSALLLKKVDAGTQLILADCYGVAGEITAGNIACSLVSGSPVGSIYENTNS
ncbi:MAG: Imm50 family immunity protein [Janthinobacterium lividum]